MPRETKGIGDIGLPGMGHMAGQECYCSASMQHEHLSAMDKGWLNDGWRIAHQQNEAANEAIEIVI